MSVPSRVGEARSVELRSLLERVLALPPLFEDIRLSRRSMGELRSVVPLSTGLAPVGDTEGVLLPAGAASALTAGEFLECINKMQMFIDLSDTPDSIDVFQIKRRQ